MATNDWKAELRRRIDDIKEKKKTEGELEIKANAYNRPQELPQKQTINPAKVLKTKNRFTGKSIRKQEIDQPVEAEKRSPESAGKIQRGIKTAAPERLKRVEATPAPAVVQEKEKPSNTRVTAAEMAELSATVVEEAGTIVESSSGRMEKVIEPTLFALDKDSEPEKKVFETEIVAENISQQIPKDSPREMSIEEEEMIPADLMKMPDRGQDGEEPEHQQQNEVVERHTVLDKKRNHINLLRIGAGIADLAFVLTLEGIILWVASLIIQADVFALVINAWIPGVLLFLALHFVYYTLLTAATGQTPGKSLFGIKVVEQDRSTIGIPKAILRWLLSYISLALAGIGYLMMFISKKGQTLHDMILRMRVIISE